MSNEIACQKCGASMVWKYLEKLRCLQCDPLQPNTDLLNKISALEHELQQQYHRGWLAGMEVESDRRRKLVGLLREATAYELGVTLRDDINSEIVEAEKLG